MQELLYGKKYLSGINVCPVHTLQDTVVVFGKVLSLAEKIYTWIVTNTFLTLYFNSGSPEKVGFINL